MPMDIQEIRQLADMVAASEAQQVRLREALRREGEAYAKLTSQHGLDEGWRVMRDPLHRLEEKNHHVAQQIRRYAVEWPLTTQILWFEGIEWWVTRPAWALTDAQLDSDRKYRETFNRCVARGECKPRTQQEAGVL